MLLYGYGLAKARRARALPQTAGCDAGIRRRRINPAEVNATGLALMRPVELRSHWNVDRVRNVQRPRA